MILIGQYDSPFVRRVGIALLRYGLPFEHRALSVFGDGEAVRHLNPLMRVPALQISGGVVLTDSHLILDHLDRLVTEPLFPRTEPARHLALRVAGLACGLADKAVSLFYERRLHEVTSPMWESRCRLQMLSALRALEGERAAAVSDYWFGATPGHADIAVACALRFAADAHPGLIEADQFPVLMAFAARMEALAEFRQTATPFAPPS